MIKATLSSSTMLFGGRRIGAAYCTTELLNINQNIRVQKTEIVTAKKNSKLTWLSIFGRLVAREVLLISGCSSTWFIEGTIPEETSAAADV
jgi:hypothetical protein